MATNPDTAVCCACLSTDRSTFPLGRLSPTYRLLSKVGSTTDMRVCWECRAVLGKMRKFQQQVSQAYYFMELLADHGLHLRGKSLSNLEVQAVSTYDVEYDEDVIDIPVDIDDECVTTDDEDVIDIPVDIDDECVTTDDEDVIDIPVDIDDECVTTDDEQDKLYSSSRHSEEESLEDIDELIEFVSVDNQEGGHTKATLDHSNRVTENALNSSTNTVFESRHEVNIQSSINSHHVEDINKLQPKTLDRHKIQDKQNRILNDNIVEVSNKPEHRPINTRSTMTPSTTKSNLNDEGDKQSLPQILSMQKKDENQLMILPKCPKEGIGSTVRVFKPIVLNCSNKINFKINKQEQNSFKPTSAKNLTKIQFKKSNNVVQVVVLISSSNIVMGLNKQPSIECVIINNLDTIQLEKTLNLLTFGKQVSVLKEITLRRPATLSTFQKIKNKLWTFRDMLGTFGMDWVLQLKSIQAANQKPISLKQWLLDKVNMQTHSSTTNHIIPFKPRLALNQKQEVLKFIPVCSQFEKQKVSNQKGCFQSENVHRSGSEFRIIPALNQNKVTLNTSSSVLNQLENETTQQQLITEEWKNKNITNNVEGTRVNSVLQIVYSEEVHDDIVILGSHTYNPNIPIALTDDEDEQDIQDDGLGYQDDAIVCHAEDIEITNDGIAMLENVKTETDNGRPKKGKPDEAILDLLDPMDQFGVNLSERGITYQAIALMKTFLKEGKVKKFKMNLSDVQVLRHRFVKQLKDPVCKFCCVRINGNLPKHVRKYHTNTAGPHVCSICSRHFRTEEMQRAHYQRHFYVYRCMRCKKSQRDSSILRMVRHIQKDESKARKREGIIVPREVKIPQKVDDATIETLDAIDRFGMRITYRKINEVKKYEEDGKVERFVATLSQLMTFRKFEMHSYGKVNKERCFMCIVRIPDDKMEEHMGVYHSEAAGPHVCAICSCHFRTEEAQSAHYQRHFNMYRCRVGDCEYATPSIKKIWSHVYRKERGLSVRTRVFDGKCDICGGNYINPTSFRNHYRQHMSKEKYECDICGKVCNTRNTILAHVSKHNKKFMCEHCGYRVNNKFRFVEHTMSHLSYEERIFVCSFCNKKFTTRNKLREHEAQHGEKILLCAYCEVMFTSKDDLSRHVKLKHPEKQQFQVHAKYLPHKCNECEKEFASKRSLDIHLISHSGETPYS